MYAICYGGLTPTWVVYSHGDDDDSPIERTCSSCLSTVGTPFSCERYNKYSWVQQYLESGINLAQGKSHLLMRVKTKSAPNLRRGGSNKRSRRAALYHRAGKTLCCQFNKAWSPTRPRHCSADSGHFVIDVRRARAALFFVYNDLCGLLACWRKGDDVQVTMTTKSCCTHVLLRQV